MPNARAFPRAWKRALGASAGLAIIAALYGPAPASAQSLFEALFGRSAFQPAPQIYAPPTTLPPAYLPPPRRYTPKRITREPGTHSPRNEASAKPARYTPPPVMPGPLGRFLRDPTLRQGDVVATVDGLMVFRGAPGPRHNAKDFVPVAQSGRLIAGKPGAELAKLDKAVRRGEPASHVSVVAENDPPIVAQDEGRRRRR